MKEHSRHYLAHEYFNRDWHPMHFATMAEWLEGAKLQFACSANYMDHVEAVNLTEEQQIFLKDIPDPMFRETTRDFMVNQQFRRDYWVKGARKMSTLEKTEALRGVRVLLTTPKVDIVLKVTGALGEATLTDSVYTPILDLLSDHKVKTLGQIEQEVKDHHISFAQISQAILVLVGVGHIALVQDDQVISKAKKHTDKLNACLFSKARVSHDISSLSSPMTGGGITLNRFQQLFLSSLLQGKKEPVEWACYAWQLLATQGQKLVKDGMPLETADENLAELTIRAQAFADKQLPILRALQIA